MNLQLHLGVVEHSNRRIYGLGVCKCSTYRKRWIFRLDYILECKLLDDSLVLSAHVELSWGIVFWRVAGLKKMMLYDLLTSTDCLLEIQIESSRKTRP